MVTSFTSFLIKISQLIRDLHNATTSNSEIDDQSQRGTQLLEIYALEIQMYNETRNFKKLKVSYPILYANHQKCLIYA